MTKIAFRGGWVVGWIDGRHQVLEGGTVVVEKDRIIFVGFPDDPACPSADRVIFTQGKLVSPGLINLHCIANLDLQVLSIDTGRSLGPGLPISMSDSHPDQTHIFSDGDFRTSAEFCVATLLKAGNTSYAGVTTGLNKMWEDPIQEPYALAEASENLGVRAWLAHFYEEAKDFAEVNGKMTTIWDKQKAQHGLDRAIEFNRFLDGRGDGRLTGFLFPYRTEKCSDDLLRETMRQSKLLGDTHVRSHFSQHLDEFEDAKKRTGKSMIEWLQDIGFLGSQVCLTHARYIAGHSLTGDPLGKDLEILADSLTSVCHCPVISARNARGGLQSLSKYVSAGVNVGIGCDSFPPDLIEEMRVGALVNKELDHRKDSGTVKEFFDAATIGGAKALGRNDIGRLAAGCLADISVFNLESLALGPIDDPMRTFVHYGHGSDCEKVMVNGRLVVDEGRVIGVDEEELLSRVNDSWARYRTGTVRRNHPGKSVDEIYPPVIPIVRRTTH